MKLVGARRLARPRLPDSESGGSAVPREPRADKMASLTGFAPVISCMRGRHIDWTTPQGRNGAGEWSRTVVLASARPHSAIEPHPRNGVPSRTFTSNLTLRTRPLYALSYGDKSVRASGNAPDPGTHLVRCEV